MTPLRQRMFEDMQVRNLSPHTQRVTSRASPGSLGTSVGRPRPVVVWALSGGPWRAWIGVIPLATAAIGFCPLYVPFGISTCAKK